MRAKGMEPTGKVSQVVRKPSFMKAAGAGKRKTFSLPGLPPELEASVNTPKSTLPLHSKGEADALQLLHTVGKYANITRPILTSIDVSNPFRQTWQLTSDQITKDLSKVFSSKYRGEDTSAYRNVRDMVKAWASEDFYQKAKAELEQDQWYIAGKEKGLNYASREHPNEAYTGKEKLELFLKKTGLEKAGWVMVPNPAAMTSFAPEPWVSGSRPGWRTPSLRRGLLPGQLSLLSGRNPPIES